MNERSIEEEVLAKSSHWDDRPVNLDEDSLREEIAEEEAEEEALATSFTDDRPINLQDEDLFREEILSAHDPLHEWQPLEYRFQEKSTDWYWILAIIAFGGAVAAIIFGNILFALVIALSAFTIALYAGRRPRRIRLAITSRGIVHDEDLHLYQHIESFWIEEHAETPTLYFHTRKLLYPHMVVPLEETDPAIVRHILLNFLDEIEHQEPLVHRLANRLGF